MKTFKDNKERNWNISLTLGDAKRVRDLLGVDLLQPEAGEPPLLTRLATDEILLCDVIYVLVKPQADRLSVTDEEFGMAMGGEAILAAQSAFYEELIDFFQKRGRADRAKAVTAQKTVITLAIEKATQTISNLDMVKHVDQTFGELSTNWPVLSESTPQD